MVSRGPGLDLLQVAGEPGGDQTDLIESLGIHPDSGEVPKNRASRNAVSAVIPRFSRTMSLIRGVAT